MRVLMIGDIGVQDGSLHVGDEAMLEEAVRALRARGATSIVATSADPADSAERYGIEAIARVGFAADRRSDDDAREARLAAITATLLGERGGLHRDDPAHAVLAAVVSCDLVLVTGAGNLSSLWPQHIYERLAVARMAARLGRRLVVSGQTLGPTLSDRHGALVAELLGTASLVGVREQPSAELATRLGIVDRLVRTYDDALALPTTVDGLDLPQRRCSVTVAPSTGVWPEEVVLEGIATLLDHVVDAHDLDVVLVPHVAGPDDADPVGDAAIHARVVARMRNRGRTHQLGRVPSAIAAGVAATSELTISTRYHPVVFALAAGRPALGLSVDHYTDVKISGALRNQGAGALALPVIATADRTASAVVDAAMTMDREALLSAASLARAEMERWWDAVASGDLVQLRLSDTHTVLPSSLADDVASLAAWQRAQSEALVGPLLVAADADVLERRHRAEVHALELALGEAEAARAEVSARAAEHEHALWAAHDRIAALAEPAIERMWVETRSRRHTPAAEVDAAWEQLERERAGHQVVAVELAALQQTRTMRWTRSLRTAYRRVLGL